MRPADKSPTNSLLMSSAVGRMGAALLLIAVLWLAVGWALSA